MVTKDRNMARNFAPTPRYDRATVAFHWLTAALVLLLWLMAQSEGFLPREARHAMWSVHIVGGGALIATYVARLGWRIGAAPAVPSLNRGAMRFAERAVHALLYVLLAATLVLGVVNLAVRGWDLFGLIRIPAFAPDDRALRRAVNGWHELGANMLIGLAAAHAAAALFHQFVLKDRLLRRMWF